MDINNNDTVETSTWKSCCLQVDKNAVKYVIQVATIGEFIYGFPCHVNHR